MAEKKDILAKFSQSQQEANAPTMPQGKKDLLADINSSDMTGQSALPRIMTEIQVGAELTSVDPARLSAVKIKDGEMVGTTINLFPATMQNLDVVHAANFAVKPITTDRAHNQAPMWCADVFLVCGSQFFQGRMSYDA
jgi:hypothetical protein